jgi:endonuclease-3
VTEPGPIPYRGHVPSAMWTPPTPRRVRAVRDRLRAVYGIPRMAVHGDGLAELVLTVLSQSTNDRNRDVAYLGLRARLPTWDAVRDAPLEEVEEAIRPGGLSKVKSERIQRILRAISTDPRPGSSGRVPQVSTRAGRAAQPSAQAGSSGRVPLPSDSPSLDWLPQVELGQARDYLTGLPGVGRKTAACVLLFAYGLREVPVDTHVARVGGRLQLLRAGAPFTELHDQMLSLTPPGEELELHVNLLRHGRRTCHARVPACGECALARMCPSRRPPDRRARRDP